MKHDEKSDASFGVEQRDPVMIPPANRPTPKNTGEPDPMVETVAAIVDKIASIETKLEILDVLKTDLQELHVLMLGIPHPQEIHREYGNGNGNGNGDLDFEPSSKTGKTIGNVFQAWTENLRTITANTSRILTLTQTMFDKHQEYADNVARVHQENVEIKATLERLMMIGKLRLSEDQKP